MEDQELPCGPCSSAAGEEIYHGPMGCQARHLRDDGPEKPMGFWTDGGGFIQLIPPGPVTPRELDPDEQREAAQRYMQARYAESADPWVTGGVYDVQDEDTGATAVYNAMVHRNTEGPDPLVPEP